MTDPEFVHDPDAPLVMAVLRQLATVPEPERVMTQDLPGLPRQKAAWVRLILRALREVGAEVWVPDDVLQPLAVPRLGGAPPVATIQVLALDLEGTLIETLETPIPGGGLAPSLQACQALVSTVVLVTVCEEADVRPVLAQRVADGEAPAWFAGVPVVAWTGQRYKDLRCLGHAPIKWILLVDDDRATVHPEQEDRWIRIAPVDWLCPSVWTGWGVMSVELAQVLTEIVERVRRGR